MAKIYTKTLIWFCFFCWGGGRGWAGKGEECVCFNCVQGGNFWNQDKIIFYCEIIECVLFWASSTITEPDASGTCAIKNQNDYYLFFIYLCPKIKFRKCSHIKTQRKVMSDSLEILGKFLFFPLVTAGLMRLPAYIKSKRGVHRVNCQKNNHFFKILSFF